MTTAGTADIALDIFGGLVTDMAPADLPAGVSPDCQDVAFVPGSVKTRPGLQSMFTAIAGNPRVNYLKTYVTQTGLLRLLALDAAGSLWKESPAGALSLISSTNVPGSFGKSASLFTREYLALGDGKFGIDIPRQFDDTNYDRVSQVGPGLAPSAQDEIAPLLSIQTSPSGAGMTATPASFNAAEVGNVVTLTAVGATSIPLGVLSGDPVVVAGFGVGGYNGTFNILAVDPAGRYLTYLNTTTGLGASSGGTIQLRLATITTTTPHGFGSTSGGLITGLTVTLASIGVAGYNGTWSVRAFYGPSAFAVQIASVGLAASGSGTVTVVGNIPAGVHKLTVVFVTRQGYITKPAPVASYTAGGGKRAFVSQIPIGPSNVVARILLFTLTGQSSYFYSNGITGIFSSNFTISDNTSTSVTVDFSDVGLASENSGDSFFNLQELGESSGVISYAERLFWWGERNKISNFTNLSFDGGFAGNNAPLGWLPDAINFTGGGVGSKQVWGSSYGITGTGATGTRGLISQSAYQDSLLVPILLPNTSYSVRARFALGGVTAFLSGAVHVFLQGTGISPAGLTVNLTALTSSFVEYSAVLPQFPGTTIPADAVLQVYADGTLTNGAEVDIDNIEVYPTSEPFNTSLVRASIAEDPESYDGVTGFMLINENDGFSVRSAFQIRENLYLVKEHGIYVTQDDGTNEPSSWQITEVSRKVGTPSVNGVAVGEDWAVIADRSGLYITDGGEPSKISQEVQPTWDRINWAVGYTIWTQVDVQNKRIHIGLPLDTATTPNTVLTLDYRGCQTYGEIVAANPIHTSYSGKLIVLEKSRKWSPWTISSASGAIVERFDGTQKLFLGNSVGNGKIYQLTDGLFTDDSAFIPSYYVTYFHFSHELEQMFQIGSHYKLFTYMSLFVEGSGQLLVSSVLPGNSTLPIASLTQGNPGLRDAELPINVSATRSAFKLQTSNPGDWFRLARFIANATKHPMFPVRGWN